MRVVGDALLQGQQTAEGGWSNLDLPPPAFTAPTTALAAAECASGLLERLVSTAQVVTTPLARPSITQELLALTTRGMLMQGSTCLYLSVSGGQVEWLPALYQYRDNRTLDIDIPLPQGDIHLVVDRASCAIPKWSVDPQFPWVAVGPWQRQQTSRLGASTEAMLGRESRGKSGYQMVHLRRTGGGTGDGYTTTIAQQLEDKLAQSGGGDVSAMALSGGMVGSGRNPASSTRFGFAPPKELLDIAMWTAEQTLAAAGISSLLFSANQAVTRDAIRAVITQVAQPVASRIAEAMSLCLEAPVELRVGATSMGADEVVSRSRSVNSLRSAGLSLAQAMEVAGLADRLSGPVQDVGPQIPTRGEDQAANQL